MSAAKTETTPSKPDGARLIIQSTDGREYQASEPAGSTGLIPTIVLQNCPPHIMDEYLRLKRSPNLL
jgi:hypothetical protein